ncbi:MAG: glycosyltransferase family 2 protein [Solirubrobacteraceae bacterium]
MTGRPTASIVIPTLAAADYLEVALDSVVPQAVAAGAEVIVVSDGPDQATTEVAEHHGVRLVTLPEQRGLNSARNAGIAAARSDLLIFIDQDVSAPAGWLEALVRGVRGTPDREVFGGPIRAQLERSLRACGREPAPITTLDAGPEDRDIPLVWGANMAIRRSAFERTGQFEENLYGRGDEEDWELRFTAAGGRIRYLAAAGIDHRRSAADSALPVLARAAYEQGQEARRHDVRVHKARPLRNELRILAGCVWHTVRRRCEYGIVMTARSAGSVREALSEHRS